MLEDKGHERTEVEVQALPLTRAVVSSPPSRLLRRGVEFVRIPGVGAGLTTVITFSVFALIAEYFLTLKATGSYLTIASELAVVAVGVTLLMIAGRFDISVGSTLGLSALSVPLLMEYGMPALPAVVAGLVVAAVVGLTNGLIVTYTLAPSLIITLGAMMVWRGVIFALTKGFPVPVNMEEPLFRIFSTQWFGGLNISAIWALALVLILSFLLLRTPFGNWIFAIGGNPEAARKSGIPIARVTITLYILAAVLAGLAGIIQMSRFGSVDPLRGSLVELRVIAAAVIGGTRLHGGSGSVWGTAFGVLTFGMIQVGLQLALVPGYFFEALVGLVLILAALANEHSMKLARTWR